MKAKPSTITKLTALSLVGLCLAVVPRAAATDGKWTSNASANWWDTTRWTNSQVADGIDARALVEANFSAARTITLNTTPVTLGNLRYNDTASTYYDCTLASSGGSVLTLQTSSGTPIVDINRQTLNFSTAIAGNQGFQKIGGGTAALANAANSNAFSGKILVTAGTLRVSSQAALGAYPPSYVADQITLNGGSLMNNTSETELGANIGITLGASGGGLQSGWGRFLTINGVISGSSNLTARSDTTPAPISLNADNTYTGKTSVGHNTATGPGAILLVNGSLAAASAVFVYTNGCLGGVGTVNGPVAVSTNGMVGPGGISTPGTLTINNNLAVTNAHLRFDLANTTTVGGGVNDLLQVNGDLTLRGVITVTVNPTAGSLATGTYRLINYTGTLDAVGATFVCNNPRLGATFDTSVNGQVNLAVANVTPASLRWTGINGATWDISTTANFGLGNTADVFYQGDAVVFDDSGNYSAGVGFIASGPNFGIVAPSAVTVNTTNDFTLGVDLGSDARLGGGMNLYKGGRGILTLAQQNNSNPNVYDGVTIVTNGWVWLADRRVLGSTNGSTIVTNLGGIDTRNQSDIYEPMVLQGSGPDGSGVVVNNVGNTVNNGLRGPVTLAGDVTFGGAFRWDVYGGGLAGNGHKITKLGANEISLANLGETGVGDIDVNEGQLTILGTTRAASAGSHVAVVSNAVFAFWAMNNDAATPFVKDIALTNSNFRSNSGTNYHSGTITLDGTNSVTSTAHMSLLGSITGPGGMRKTGTGVLDLEAANTYKGVTFVDAGTLWLGSGASLAGSSLISVGSGANLDVTTPASGLTLGAGQTLAGSGSVWGNVTAGAGSAVSPGASPGTLTINGNLALQNSTLVFELGGGLQPSDQISAWGVSPTGVNTIKVLPLSALDSVLPYNLIASSSTAMPSGSETKFQVITDSRYNLTVLPTDASAGYFLQVQVSGTGSPATNIWQGADSANPTLWDLKTTSNWLNGVTVDKFYAGDTVVFNDSAIGTTANLVGVIQPGSVLLSNASKSITIGGSGSLVTPILEVDGAGTTTLANDSANQVINGLTLNAGTFVVANSAPNDLGPTVNLNGGTLVFSQSFDTTVASVLASYGYGTVRKENTNTLTLSAANSGFLGIITVNNGILRAGSATALGDVTYAMNVNPGGSLNVNGQNLATKIVNAAGAGYNGLGAIMNTGAGQNNALQQVVLTGNTVFGGPNRWDIRGSSTVYGALKTMGGGTYNITKIGPQQHSLVNVIVDPTLGDIDVQEGIFGFESGTAGRDNSTWGLGDPMRTVTVHSNATLFFYDSTNAVDKRVRMDGGSILRVNRGGANRIIGPATLGEGVVTLNGGSGYTLYVDGPVGGPGGLEKYEQSTFSFGNSNWFAGDVAVYRGNLIMSNSFALGTNKTVSVNYNVNDSGGNGTRLYLRGGITTPDDLVGLYTAVNSPGDYRCSITSDVLTNTWAGPTILEGSGIVGFYRNNATAEFNITGPIIGTNGFTGKPFFRGNAAGYGGQISGKVTIPNGVLAITDNTAWLFSNPDNVWSTNQIAYGKFILGADNAACASSVFELGQSGSSSGTLDLNGFNQTVPLIYTINGANHWITNGSATTDSAFTYAGGADVSTFNGNIVDGARNLSVTVNSGTLSLLGNNTYKGSTLVKAGRLLLGPVATLGVTPLITLQSGAVLDTSAMAAGLTLGSGQTLAGTGTVEGSLTIASGATLSAGSSIGALTVTNVLAFLAGGTNVVEVNSGATPSSDVVNAAAITYGGTLVVNNLGAGLKIGDSFKLFNAVTYAGAFDQILPAEPATGLGWDTSSLAVDGTLKVATGISLTPTPLSVAIKAGGMDLSWPADHIGWRLESQTNALSIGLSTNWVTVPGSASTNSVSINFDANPNSVFFRLVYP